MVKPGDVEVSHFVGDGVVSVPGQPIDAGSDQEVRPELLGQTEQFVDIALAVANVNAAFRGVEQRDRLAHVFQPAEAFLLFDRHARGVDLPLQSGRALEFLSIPT